MKEFSNLGQFWLSINQEASRHPVVMKWLTPFLVLTACALVYIICKKIILRLIHSFLHKFENPFTKALLVHRAADHLAYLLPLLVFYQYCLGTGGGIYKVLATISLAGVILVLIFILDDLLDSILSWYESLDVSKEKPVRGYFQVVKILLWIMGFLLVLAALMNRSPLFFLSGIGAITAILMLVFKDTILSLVAAFQIQFHNLIKIGDWIEMPEANADGDVIEIALHTVKIQNWDKTISSIPTYKFIQTSFKNWKGMTEWGGRRICRSIHLDLSSVRMLDQELLKRLEGISLLEGYLDERQKQIEKHNSKTGADRTKSPVNGRCQTNLGVFRRYLVEYLKKHEHINENMTQLVRQQAPTEMGIPMQIYCFTKTTAWAEYEGIQADLFDHIFSILQEFELKVFQNPTGGDIRSLNKTI